MLAKLARFIGRRSSLSEDRCASSAPTPSVLPCAPLFSFHSSTHAVLVLVAVVVFVVVVVAVVVFVVVFCGGVGFKKKS